LLLRTAPDRLLFELKKIHYLRALRAFIPPDRQVLDLIVRPGDHVLDLGANVGWYTKALSGMVGPAGRVYSVEPVPDTFALLSFCVRRLRLDNVELINCAVSDRTGTAVMEVPLYHSGGENFYQARLVSAEDTSPAAGPLRTLTVRVRSVDSMFLELPGRLSFVKIDVEGHEWAAIAGSRRTLERHHPALFLEVTTDPDRGDTEAHQLFAYLRSAGYQPFWSDERGLIFLTASHVALLAKANVTVQ
jgi:FkbM family methyltransferase